ncbi:MAG: hypothetical protein ACYC7A_21870 [Thermoanaerobaculia bacterium]
MDREPSIFMGLRRSHEADASFAVLGRLLLVATHFEWNCRTLTGILAIREDPAKILTEGVDKLLDGLRTRTLKMHLKELPFSGFGHFDELMEILEAARVARNEVAHEIAGGLGDLFEKDVENLNERMARVGKLALTIAVADGFVSAALSVLSDSPLPPKEFIDHYDKAVVGWVIEKRIDAHEEEG